MEFMCPVYTGHPHGIRTLRFTQPRGALLPPLPLYPTRDAESGVLHGLYLNSRFGNVNNPGKTTATPSHELQ
jgi:hypothetical protein